MLDTLRETPDGPFLLGYDTRLLRRVWVRQQRAGAMPIPTALRSIGRVGRLRWLNGRRSDAECWDAYEAVSGTSLLNLIDKPQPWSIVRYWLLDLARELAAASRDATLPEVLSLDRVWITADNRVKLLDFPTPEASPPVQRAERPPESKQRVDPRRFLLHVGRAALLGDAASPPRDGPPPIPLPVEARQLLSRDPVGAEWNDIHGALRQLVGRTPVVTRARRAAMLALTAAFPLFVALLSVGGLYMVRRSLQRHPEIAELQQCLTHLGIWSVFVAIPGLFAAIAFRRGLVMRAFGVDCATRSGEAASRLRMFWRAILFHAPVAPAPLVLALLLPLKLLPFTAALLVVAALVVLAGVLSLLLPRRGLADRLSGTCLVLR